MDVVYQGISGKQNQLYCWDKKKNIECPTCKESIFQFDESLQFSSVPVTNEIVQSHHKPCPSSVGNCGKAIFFCLSCGSHSSHTLDYKIEDANVMLSKIRKQKRDLKIK